MKNPQLKTHGTVKLMGGNLIEMNVYSTEAQALRDEARKYATIREDSVDHSKIKITVFDGFDTQEVFEYLWTLLDNLNKTLTTAD